MVVRQTNDSQHTSEHGAPGAQRPANASVGSGAPGEQALAAPAAPAAPASAVAPGGESFPNEQVTELPLSEVLRAIADGVIIVDEQGMVRYANPAAGSILNRPVEELLGQEFGFPLVVGETTEIDVIRPGQEPVTVEMRTVTMRWAGGAAHLASLRDITERKQAEQQRIQLVQELAARERAEAAVQARDEFLSVAAHELKTPVARLRLAVQLVMRYLERGQITAENVHERLRSVDQETEKLSRMVTQLLDISRIETGKLPLEIRDTDLVPIISAAVATSQASTDHHTVRYTGPQSLIVPVDPLRIEQVIANLLDNAVKYSVNGGHVQVELEQVTDDSGTAQVRLAVTDSGMGIPPEHRAGIFERFYQAHTGDHLSGLGLGLYVCREIIQQHGGTIEVQFPEQGGTRFVVTLPAKR